MENRKKEMREREYDEMERGGLSASFHRPPWYLTAAGTRRKEEGNGIRKEAAYPEGEKSECRI